jgi:hypothetical protein
MRALGESVVMMNSTPVGATIRDLENEGKMSNRLFDSTNCLLPNSPCTGMLLLDFHILTPARNSTVTRACKPVKAHQGRVAAGAYDDTLLR